MPQIDVTLPANTLDGPHKEELVSRLTQSLFKWEGVPTDSPSIPFGWAYIHETNPGEWAFGGKIGSSAEQPRYRVAITTPAGVLDAEHKKGLIAEVTAIIAELEGSPQAAYRVTCYVLEVPESGYGAAGQVYQRRPAQSQS